MEENNNKNIEEKVDQIKAEIDEQAEESVKSANDDVKKAVSDAKDVFTGLINDLKAALNSVPNTKEEWDAAVDSFKKGAGDLSAKAQARINEMKNDPETAKTLEGIKNGYTSVADKIVTFCKSSYGKVSNAVSNSEQLKNTGSQIVNKGQDALNYMKAKYEDFTNNPEVQATVVKARDKVVDYANKATEAVKKAINGDDKED